MPIRVTIWNEFRHEKTNETIRNIYPDGIHNTIGAAVKQRLGDAVDINSATLDEPEHGLTQDVVDHTDVMLWWGHAAHQEVADEIVERVYRRVLKGMGLMVLHSSHYSKIFKRLMGTDCGLLWREAAERERIWCVNPGHPITNGLGAYIELDHSEMYGEHFDIPTPDELIYISWFEGGEVFRTGCTWTRGKGRVFYFGAGHETFPIYHNADIQQVIANGVQWLAPAPASPYRENAAHAPVPLSPIAGDHEVDESIH
ncbi:MAG: ThuA domain-containing protein [Lentisphaeria bacterium]|jgi:trehalose utilization protein|nr:ThuA domain-containing protein [Lentisphaeria bacterium]MDP7742282.1 ThuA domain-containing protein [Lentisphaeria bacterium]